MKKIRELTKNEYNVDTDDMTDEEVVKHFRKLNAKRKEEKARAAEREKSRCEDSYGNYRSHSHRTSSSIWSTLNSPATTMLRFL